MKTAKWIVAAMLVLGMCSCGVNGSQENDMTPQENKVGTDGKQYEKTKLRLSFGGTNTGIDGMVANKMKDMLYERSGGQVILDTFASAQLAGGSMQRHIEMTAAGAGFDLAILGETIFGSIDSAFLVTGLPFAFETYENAYAYADSTGGEWQKKKYDELGILHLETFSNSLMQITNGKKEIHLPSDLKDMKMRVADIGQIAINRALGSDAVSVNFSELYSALQMGTVDGQMNGYQTLYSSSIYEVQPYLTECNIIWGAYDILANKNRWENLNPDVQELVMEVARECSLWAREYVSKQESMIKEGFLDYGIQITELSDQELQEFKEATRPVIDSYKEEIGEEAYRAWGILQ